MDTPAPIPLRSVATDAEASLTRAARTFDPVRSLAIVLGDGRTVRVSGRVAMMVALMAVNVERLNDPTVEMGHAQLNFTGKHVDLLFTAALGKVRLAA